MLLDTTFVIDLLRNDPGAIKKAKELNDSGEDIFSSAITVFEVWQGAEDLKNQDKRDGIDALLSSLGLMALDVECAKEGGAIHSECYRNGVPIDPQDSMIAGIAKHHHQTVLTRNIRHFSRIRGINVERY